MSAEPESSADLESVPKLPRGRGLKFSKPELFRIALMAITLIGILALARPCADSVSGFVLDMDGSAAPSGKAMPTPGNVTAPETQHFEELRPGMTEEELKAAVERSRARAAGSGSIPASPAP